LNIKTGDGTLTDLITACDDPMAISINFQMFANDGVTAYVDEPVISQFLKSHEPDEFNGEKAIEVKSLFKRDLDPQIQFYGAHRPFLRKNVETPPHWTDGSGKQVASRYAFAATKARKRKFRAINSRDLATLNHYTLRSLESYLVKTDRGDANREHRVFEDDYWNERNDCTYSDDSILNYMPRLQAEMDALKALPGVADQHAACVKAHADKAASLMAQPQYIELRDRLAKQDGKSG
jgi:hypothetical protein